MTPDLDHPARRTVRIGPLYLSVGSFIHTRRLDIGLGRFTAHFLLWRC